jgi:BirA family biotin operon repressor/biotin-[acetyl-CoA-carboxylase] ligase
MLLLSDCPERLAGLARSEDGSEAPADSLPPGERALWRALGGGDRMWRGTARDPGPSGFWSRAMVVAEAPASQFDSLRESLAAGLELPGPTAFLALTGRGFRGQRDRPWLTAAGNLHLCVVLPDPGVAAREAGSLPMLPAVALVDAVRRLSGGAVRPGIKWVNDVVVGGRKVGGVLTASQTRADRIDAILLGIGLNVATAPAVPPTPFVPAVACLAGAGIPVTWAEAASAVLEALARRVAEVARGGPKALLEAYRADSVVIGREVCVFPDPEPGNATVGSQPARVLRGTVRGIAADLSLVLEGAETPVASGRLAFAENCPRTGR